MPDRVLILGSGGKMGSALKLTFHPDYTVIGLGRSDFDAVDFGRIRAILAEQRPDIVINTIAFLGIDNCEENYDKAFILNALFPKLLAELSREMGFILIHFSSDAVFGGEKQDYYLESDAPAPLNVYGRSKADGDRYVQEIAERYYLVRVSLLFGPSASTTQFVEKMLANVRNGSRLLKISDDIILSPSYTSDVAQEVRRILEVSLPFGLYHVANRGNVSLYEFMVKLVGKMYPDTILEPVSWRSFPSRGIKNSCTPLASEKLPPLRPWAEAVQEYCTTLTGEWHP